MTHKEQIDRTRERIRDCKLIGEDAKEGLQSLLDDAFPSDGNVDANELLSTLCNQWVLHVLNSYTAIEAEVKKHEITCPMKDLPKGKLGVAMQFAKCWPLMVALTLLGYSPHLPVLLQWLEKVLK